MYKELMDEKAGREGEDRGGGGRVGGFNGEEEEY